MLITKDIVIINNPKTGSTFVRACLNRIHENRGRSLLGRIKQKLRTEYLHELILPNIKVPDAHPDQHGTYRQIPSEHLNKEVVSVVRNPFSKFLSAYKFRHWASYPILDKNTLKQVVPNFPNLSMDEFVDYHLHSSEVRAGMPTAIGNQTIQFVQMFCKKDPQSVLKKLSSEYVLSGNFKEDFASVTFLKQENLSEELAQLLKRKGYYKKEIEWARTHKKVNVTQDSEGETELSKKAIEYVRNRENYLLMILKELGFDYSYPYENIHK